MICRIGVGAIVIPLHKIRLLARGAAGCGRLLLRLAGWSGSPGFPASRRTSVCKGKRTRGLAQKKPRLASIF